MGIEKAVVGLVLFGLLGKTLLIISFFFLIDKRNKNTILGSFRKKA